MKPFSEWDFTLPRYTQLCRTFLDTKYRILTILDYLVEQEALKEEPCILLRHDVDRRPFHALKMAQVEAGFGIKSTYYFRGKTHTFIPGMIKKIATLGHEIGYHYENLSDMNGDMARAIKDFENGLIKFRRIVPIRTICMHGSPLSKWDNRALWKQYHYTDFGIIGEPYLSINFTKMLYVSDTGRIWNSRRSNIRDRVSSEEKIENHTTADLIRALRSKAYQKIFIVCHPERWPDHLIDYLLSFCFDEFANIGKRIVKLSRHRG